MLTTSASASVTRVAPSGQLDGAGEDLGAGLEALDRDGERLGDVRGLDLELEGVAVRGDDGLRGGLALDVDGDVDGDLLALADDDEVDVLDDRLDRVALDVLGQGQCSSSPRVMVSSALACLSAIIASWPGRVMWIGLAPWPYMTAGILWSRRILRAAPLPN
jgi:hypothetical protein